MRNLVNPERSADSLCRAAERGLGRWNLCHGRMCCLYMCQRLQRKNIVPTLPKKRVAGSSLLAAQKCHCSDYRDGGGITVELSREAGGMTAVLVPNIIVHDQQGWRRVSVPNGVKTTTRHACALAPSPHRVKLRNKCVGIPFWPLILSYTHTPCFFFSS